MLAGLSLVSTPSLGISYKSPFVLFSCPHCSLQPSSHLVTIASYLSHPVSAEPFLAESTVSQLNCTCIKPRMSGTVLQTAGIYVVFIAYYDYSGFIRADHGCGSGMKYELTGYSAQLHFRFSSHSYHNNNMLCVVFHESRGGKALTHQCS